MLPTFIPSNKCYSCVCTLSIGNGIRSSDLEGEIQTAWNSNKHKEIKTGEYEFRGLGEIKGRGQGTYKEADSLTLTDKWSHWSPGIFDGCWAVIRYFFRVNNRGSHGSGHSSKFPWFKKNEYFLNFHAFFLVCSKKIEVYRKPRKFTGIVATVRTPHLKIKLTYSILRIWQGSSNVKRVQLPPSLHKPWVVGMWNCGKGRKEAED